MSQMYVFNKTCEFSRKFGGMKEVYGGDPDTTMPTGYGMPLEELPVVGQVIPAGTPFSADDLSKEAHPHYAFSAVSASGASLMVKKGFEGTRAKVGMVIMLLPKDAANIEYKGTGYEIVAVDASQKGMDVLTLKSTITETVEEGDIFVEASAEGADATIKVIPTTTSYGDIPVNGFERSQAVDLLHVCNVIYTRRVPPIHNVIRAHMYANGYFIRFYDGL